MFFYKNAFDEVVEILNATLFSVLVDESTDISNTKIMCVSVQYVDPVSGKVVQHLLQLLELDATHSTALDLFKSFKKFCDESKINMKNIVALACDNASVMVGKLKGFQVFLREIVPHLIVLNCVCHTSAIIAKSSCTAIPKEVEELVRSAYNYFANSPKRSQELDEFTEMFCDTTKKLLKLSGTRWLESFKSYERLLELWPALEHYFTLKVFDRCKTETEKSSSTSKISNEERIYKLLTDPCVQFYAHFLEFVLNYFNSFNALKKKINK